MPLEFGHHRRAETGARPKDIPSESRDVIEPQVIFPQSDSVLNKIEKGLFEHDKDKSLRMLHTLFTTASDSAHMEDFLFQHAPKREDVETLFDHDTVYKALDETLDGTIEHEGPRQFQTSMILSQVPYTKIPESTKRRLKEPAVSKHNMTIQPEFDGWYLCQEAEEYLDIALQDTAAILVNDTFLVKFNGKMSGLALQNTVTPDDHLITENTWYSPLGKGSRQAIREAFFSGQSRVDLPRSNWALMRPLLQENASYPVSAGRLFDRAKEYALSMPDSFPKKIGNVSRKRYWQTEKDDID